MRRTLVPVAEAVFPFIVVAILWEAFALFGPFPQKLFPHVETIVATFVRLVGNGILLIHASSTLLRLILAFLLSTFVGVSLGIIIGRYRWAEDFLLPLVSIGNPIPGLAYAPLFVLWFGLGNLPAVLLVAFAAAFPVVLNTWTGVRAVKEIWIRAAQAMGAADRQLFWKVVLPGALPYILTGLRLGLARAWRVLVAVEMLTSVRLGLGWLIFGAREFLNTDVMLAGIAVIGLVGFLLEKLVFEKLERLTLVRWGMMEACHADMRRLTAFSVVADPHVWPSP
jgi:NitT/TauT family transport system permease protein